MSDNNEDEPSNHNGDDDVHSNPPEDVNAPTGCRLVAENADRDMITLVTYGKRFGSINKSDCLHVWNCTRIPNPPPATRKGTTGLSKRFRTEVLQEPVAQAIVQQAVNQIVQDFALDDSDSQVRGESMYAFFCEHGKHRSVSVAERVAERVRLYRVPIEVVHRDVHRNPPARREQGKRQFV